MDVPPQPHPVRRALLRRSGLVAFGLGTLALAAGPRFAGWLQPAPGLMPDLSLPGFRRLATGAIVASSAPFTGLDTGAARSPVLPDLCAALFGKDRTPGLVPIAVFTDINCPHCRVMVPWLQALSPARVALVWHDLALLGPASEAGARAGLAAEAQGAGPAMRARLHRTRFQPDRGYVTAIASSLGLDARRLLADMEAPATSARLETARALAAVLGLPGTPSLVIGDIVAPGALDRGTLDALIRAARQPVCG